MFISKFPLGRGALLIYQPDTGHKKSIPHYERAGYRSFKDEPFILL